MGRTEILNDVHHYIKDKLSKPFLPGKTYLSPSGAQLFPEDIEAVVDATLECWFTEWRSAERLKNDLSRYLGYHPKVTLCNSGSSASNLAVTAAREHWGNDRKPYVITCATSFPTTITPIYQNGYLPFYIDIDPETLLPNLEQLDYVLAKYCVKGVFLAHNLGFPYDEKAVKAAIAKQNVWFISDVCDALGARGADGNHVGYHADLSILSMFPAHHITSGEGGAVFCRSEEVHEIVESLNNWGRSCTCKPGQQNTCGMRFCWSKLGDLPEGWDHKYVFDHPGYNFKMTELQAALGVSQLFHIDEFVQKRKENYLHLFEGLCDFEFIRLIPPPIEESYSPFGFPILVCDDAPFCTTDLITYLEGHKVGTRRVFAGNIVRQPGFKDLQHNKLDLSGSDRVMNQCLWVGCQPALTDEMIDYMLDTFHKFMETF